MTYTIKEAAAQANTSTHTLRYYEQLGLLEVGRASNGHRRYSEIDLDRVRVIMLLRDTAMPLEQIAEFICLTKRGAQTMSERVRMLKAHRAELDARIARLQTHRAKLDGKIIYYDNITTIRSRKMDSSEHTIFEKCETVLHELYEGGGETVRAGMAEMGFEGRELSLLSSAMVYAPKPISVELLSSRIPHLNADIVFPPQLASLTEKGYLETVREGHFTLTEKGADALGKFNNLLAKPQVGREQLVDDGTRELATFLEGIIDTAQANEDNHCVNHTYWTVESEADGVIMRVFRALNTLDVFRDDAHLQAWKPLGVSPIMWEASHSLWKEKPSTPAELAERLAYRKFTEADYEDAFKKLESLGWVQDGKLTEQGTAIKVEAEASTNRCFEAPFADVDQGRLCTLLGELSDKLASQNLEPA